MSTDTLKKGFMAICKRIIGLGGCFLKGVFEGQILSAMAKNDKDNIHPLDWVVVELENEDSWNWFIDILIKDLGKSNDTGWTLISDRQKIYFFLLFTIEFDTIVLIKI